VLIFVSFKLVISTSELVAVNAIAVQYVGRIDPISQLAALQIAELLLVISGSFNSVRRTDRSTELLSLGFTFHSPSS